MPYSGSTVDEQVVKMSFDNSNFDGNINDSIKALNNLDNKLLSVNKSGFASITNSINNLANTFTVKGQIMFGVLTRLGSEIVSIGNKAFRKLTQGIRDGLGEYNQIIESTQTIYQNVKQDGKSIEDVNGALDELNDYADKTIYNFGQMTRMIGMFTSAGVSLDKSVSSIKGLANAAALVGATIERAQIGWQAVSRAMSSGKFTNVTWRSLELSGIAGKQFNKVITEVARTTKVKGKQTGKDIDGMIKKWGSLRESLREGWLTKDIFTEAMDILSGALSDADLKRKGYTDKQIKDLRKIADAAEEAATRVKTFKQLMETTAEAIGSGWAQSFRILIGDLEEAKKLYTRISDVVSGFIENNANIRNKLFTQIVSGKDRDIHNQWKSGRDNFKQIIENILGVFKAFLKSVKTGFLNIFPIERISAAARKVLSIFENFTRAISIANGNVKDSGEILWDTEDIEKVSESIKDLIRFFRGLASAVDIAWMAVSQPIRVIIKRIPFFNNFFKNTNNGLIGIIEKLGKFGDRITAFRDAAKDWEIFGYLTEYFLDNIDELGQKYPILGAVLFVFNGISKTLRNLKKGFKELNIKPLSAIFGAFKMVVTSVWKILNGLFGLIRNAKNSIDWSWLEGPKRLIINTLRTFSDYGRGLITFEQATKRLGGFLGSFFSKISKIFSKNDVTNKIVTASHTIDKQYSNLNTKITQTGKKVESIWDKITGFFAPIGEFFKTISTNGNLTFDGFSKKIALLGGGIAAATISVSHLVKTFGKIRIIDNLNNLLTAGIDVVKAYQREAQSKAILNIAVAIGILAVSMAALSFIPYERLENGLVIFTSFMAVLAMTLPPIINAMAKFNESVTKMNDSEKPINALIKTLGKFGKQIAAGLNAKMIGKMFKDIAIGLFILVGAIAALTLLFKYDRDNTITAIIALAKVLGILTAAVAALTVAVNLFSKSYKESSTSVGVFAQFFKLSGVAKIILSISAAVLVLVGALAIMTKLDSGRLHESWVLLMAIIGYLGLITIAVASITSRANDMGKLKKITVSITGAVLGVAAIVAAMALLISETKKDNTNAWIKSLVMFSAIIGQFTAMTVVLLLVAKKVGGQTTIWTKLEKMMTVMTACLVAISGVLFFLGYSRPIPASVVTTIGIMTAAMLGIISLLALVAIVMSKAKSTFTTNFVKVIEGISLSIAALIASLGVMAAGIATLIFTLSSIDIPQSDANKASSNVVNKLAYIAEVIAKALPELKKLFYSIGTSIGAVFTSFTTGFVDQVISVGETYNNVAEKFVNLIIDLVGKVVTILKSRKEDIAKIIGDVVDFLGTEITAALNAFFKKDGEGMFKQEDVLKWMGITTLTGTGIHIVAENAKDINAIVTLLDNAKKVIKGLSLAKLLEKVAGLIRNIKGFGEGLITTFSKIKIAANTAYQAIGNGLAQFKSWVHSLHIFEKIGNVFTKVGTKIKTVVTALKPVLSVLWNIFAVAVAVVGIIMSVIAVFNAFKRYTGEVKNAYDENASGIQKATQAIVDGFAYVGRIIIQVFMTVIRTVAGLISYAIYAVISFGTTLFNWFTDFVNIVAPNSKFAKSLNSAQKQIHDFADSFKEVGTNSFKDLVSGWKDVGNFSVDETNWNGAFAKKQYENGKEASENYKQGSIDGLDGLSEEMRKKIIESGNELISANKEVLDEHSPSKVSYGIYWNYILGASNAMTDGGKVLLEVMKTNNKKLIKENITGVNSLSEAYNKLGITDDSETRRSGIHRYDVSYKAKNDDGTEEYRKVELNKELTEAIIAQKEALIGKSKEEAEAYIRQQAFILGTENGIEEAKKVTDFLYDQHEDKSSLWWSTMEDLENQTSVAWWNILSAEEQAGAEAVAKQEETNKLLMEATDSLSKKLIGKKKSEAQEILKQELISRGMSEEQAEEESKKMIALIFANQKNKTKVQQNGLAAALDIMRAETDFYNDNLKVQEKALDESYQKRLKMQGKYNEEEARMREGRGDVSSFINASRNLMEANNEYEEAKKKYLDVANEALKRMEEKGLANINQFNKDYEKAYKQANINTKKSGSVKDAISSFFKEALGKVPSAPDTSTWKLPKVDTTGNKGKDNDKDVINRAKDTKKALEAQRADLTPTFDLDKLSDEAKKANGIVTSSLMAAQNASIGDYINKDSELNPFMKDRWQNVYNFTQNNYSPKALSRTDIYRQTQRQLKLSRGF